MQIEEKKKLVKTTANAYKRKCWWADIDDMQQQAWLTICEADKAGTFKESLGIPEGAYLHRAIGLSVRRFLLQESSPVKISIGKLGKETPKRVELDLNLTDADKQAPQCWKNAVYKALDGIVRDHAWPENTADNLLDDIKTPATRKLRFAIRKNSDLKKLYAELEK